MAYRLGVDVGGTFTDLFLVGDDSGDGLFRVKTPSTPADPSQGVLNGVRRICSEAGIEVGDLRNILHGTTVLPCASSRSTASRVSESRAGGSGLIMMIQPASGPGVWERAR